MTIEDFLKSTLDDLKIRVNANKEYDTLRAAGILRQLIMDYPCLLKLVKDKYNCNLLFKISSTSLGEPIPFRPTPGGVMQFLKFDDYKNGYREVKLTNVPKIKVLRVNRYEYNLRQIIQGMSHIFGGVHMYAPRDEAEENFLEVDINSMKIAGKHFHFGLMAVKALANVTLESVRPLMDVIDGRAPAGGLEPQS